MRSETGTRSKEEAAGPKEPEPPRRARPEREIVNAIFCVPLAACRIWVSGALRGRGRLRSGEPQAVKPAAVVGESDQGPLGGDVGETAELEAGEAEG